MTREEFEHIVKIHHRLVELNAIKDEIHGRETHKLTYLYRSRSGGDYSIVSEWKQRAIGDLLDEMIRKAIDQEIDQLNKEIESL